jgi:hypothetical protein
MEMKFIIKWQFQKIQMLLVKLYWSIPGKNNQEAILRVQEELARIERVIIKSKSD